MRKLITLSALAAAMLIFVGCEIDEPSIEINDNDDAAVTQPEQPAQPAGDNTFLWKPVSETRGGRCAVLTPSNLTVKSVKVNGANHTAEYGGRANGDRQHWFLDAPGATFGRNVSVEAISPSGAVLRKWVVPDGADRWGSQ